MDISRPQSPFLQGNFAPWPQEGDFADLEVTGRIPEDLVGSFYRNGPNPAFPPLGQYHWFDGDGMIHAVTFEDGRACYRNRWVRSRALQEELRAGRALYYGLLELEKGEGRFKNAANTNIVYHGGKLLALYEGALPTRLGPVSLETWGEYDFDGRLTGPMTAHPKIDPESGEMLFFGYQPFPPYLTFHRVLPNGELARSVPLSAEWPSMVHDFTVTERYVLFFIFPLVFRLDRLGSGGSIFEWEEGRGSRVGILSRDAQADEMRWFSAPSGYVFHFMNSFEAGEKIIVDAARYPRLLFMNRAEQPSHDFDRDVPTLHRFELDLEHGGVHQTQVDERFCEFPRIHEGCMGRPYRYGYSVTRTGSNRLVPAPEFDAIARFDWQRKVSDVRSFGPHAGVGEPVFVPRAGARDEDDGYVLILVYDGQRDTSDLYVLPAQDVKTEPYAVVHLPHRVPYGFHGNWVPKAG